MSKVIRRMICCACMIWVAVVGSFNAFALSFEGQTYILDDDNQKKITIPKMYVIEKRIANIGGETPYFNAPSDLFLDQYGFLYVSDSGNNRVVKLNQQYQIIQEFKSADGLDFNTPNGVFVDEYGELFIADTKNSRIVHLDKDGKFIESFIKPESDLLKEVTSFEPNKVAINKNTGFVYMIQGKEFMTIDARNQFKGFVGAQDVGFDLKDFLFRKFASDLQQRIVGRRQPPAYNNFFINDEQMVYAVGMGQKDQIKILNSVDNNIYKPGFYGEMSYKENGEPIYPIFTDIAVSEDGIITVAEQNSAKLYQYDTEGNLLGVFGGKGTNNEHFQIPASLATDQQGRLYVLDSASNNIQILKPTRFTQLIHEANGYYLAGEYDKAIQLWQDVISLDENYPIARKSIGKIEFKNKDYQGSMQNYRIANDKEGYGISFEKERYSYFHNHFLLVATLTLTFVIGLLWLFLHYKKKAREYDDELNGIRPAGKWQSLKLAVMYVYHPIKANVIVKRYRDRFKVLPVLSLFLLAIALRIAYIYTVNYTVSDLNPTDANLLFEIVVIVLPLLTWVVANYGLLTNLSGEAKFTETLTAVSYSLVPYILTTPLFAILSQVVSYGEADIYTGLKMAVLVWQLLLIFLTLKILNDISLRKALLYSLFSLIGMLVVWGLVLLVFALTSQVGYFVSELLQEIRVMTR